MPNETDRQRAALEEAPWPNPSSAMPTPFVFPVIREIVLSMLTSLALFVIAYFWRLRTIENFFPRFGLYLCAAITTYALLIATVRRVRAYGQFPCMAGMMIGMTTGMVAGFLTSFYVGATNGLFVGSIFGMIAGVGLGVWSGSSCGVMGIMEGAMAGFMSGPMGAMTSVMLLNDHVQAMGVIVFLLGTIMLGGVNYMVFIEKKGQVWHKKDSHILTILLSVILTAATINLMAVGPRSNSCSCNRFSVNKIVP